MTVDLTIEIPDQRIADLLAGAFEGGSNYWYRINNAHARHNRLDTTKAEFLSDVPLVVPGNLVIEQDDGSDDYQPCPHDLNRSTIADGLRFLAKNQPQHFADILSENDDATTADVFLQCVVLRELVYG